MSTTNPFLASSDERWFAPAPGWWERVLALVDQGTTTLLHRDAPRGIRVMDRLGRWAQAAGLVAPTAGDVAACFTRRSPSEVRQIARASAALRFKNRAAIALLQRRGVEALSQLVDPSMDTPPASLTAPSRGRILLAFHVGAQFGVGATLHRWGMRPLTLRDMPVGDGHERARALRYAVDALRGGATIIAAVDGPGGASTGPLACLGRRIVLRRGPFMLARMMQVPLIPAMARWTTRGRIVTEFGEPLDAVSAEGTGEVETRLAEAAARWLERQLVARPGELWPYTLANLLGAPLA